MSTMEGYHDECGGYHEYICMEDVQYTGFLHKFKFFPMTFP